MTADRAAFKHSPGSQTFQPHSTLNPRILARTGLASAASSNLFPAGDGRTSHESPGFRAQILVVIDEVEGVPDQFENGHAGGRVCPQVAVGVELANRTCGVADDAGNRLVQR